MSSYLHKLLGLTRMVKLELVSGGGVKDQDQTDQSQRGLQKVALESRG